MQTSNSISDSAKGLVPWAGLLLFVPLATGMLAIGLGGIVLTGWVIGSETMQSVTGHGVSMKTNTAIALILLGSAIMLVCPDDAGKKRLQLGRTLSGLSGLIGLLTLWQHMTGMNLGIDQLLFKEEPGAIATSSPNRMGIPASSGFIMLSLSAILLNHRTAKNLSVSQCLATVTAGIMLLSFAGYFFGATQLYGISKLTGIAPHTSVALFLLSSGMVLSRPAARPVRLLFSENAGGILARRMIPVAIVLPFAIVWLRVMGEEMNWYDRAFGRALLVLAFIVIYTALIWRTAIRVNVMEQARDKALLQYQSTDEARRHSEARYKFMAESMPLVVFTVDGEGNFNYVSHAMAAYAGKAPALGQGIPWLGWIHAEDREAVASGWQESWRQGLAYESEQRIKGLDGVFRWFLMRAQPMNDSRGRIMMWFGSCTEIDDMKQASEERIRLLQAERSARADAERANRLKDEFVSTLSHELRTPLNAIMGWATLLEKGAMTEGELSHATEVILRNARNQAQLIDDLLDMSRIMTGKLRLDPAELDLREVAQAAIDSARPAARARQMLLETHFGDEPVMVWGDATRLQQVIWNLISNAIKFTDIEGKIGVSILRQQSRAIVEIRDNGRGISPDFLPYVFDRFRQEDNSITRQFGGLGLGLSIVRELVELHGGKVRAESPGDGLGSTFSLSIPIETSTRTRPRPELLKPSLETRISKAVTGSLNNIRILLVDDEADSRALMRRLLQGWQAQVQCAGSAQEALDAIGPFRPEILVSDIGMPGCDGYELMRRIRALGVSADELPAIALTAYARSEDRQAAMEAGYQVHLSKPVKPGELFHMLGQLGRRQSEAR